MDQPPFMQPVQRARYGDRESQKKTHLKRRADETVEHHSIRRIEYQEGAPELVHELQRPHGPRVFQVVLQFVLVRKAIEDRWGGSLGRRYEYQDAMAGA